MALTTEQFIELNNPGGRPAPPAPVAPDFRTLNPPTEPGPNTAVENFNKLVDLGLVIGLGPNAPRTGGGSGSSAATQRAIALKQLEIQRKRLEFQKQTGLRDIGQARSRGLRAAINNALQRGIFRSGIREFNVAEVQREAGEAETDLATNIQFALDDLKLRRESVKAVSAGGAGGSEGGLTIEEADAAARATNLFEIEQAEMAPLTGGISPLVPPKIEQGRPS